MKNIVLKAGSWFDTAWKWLVYSSANPNQISGTIKYGFLTAGVLLSGALGFAHLQFPTDQWTAIGDNTIGAVQDILLSVGAIGTVVSGLRKLWLTIVGEHASLNVTPAPQQ